MGSEDGVFLLLEMLLHLQSGKKHTETHYHYLISHAENTKFTGLVQLQVNFYFFVL